MNEPQEDSKYLWHFSKVEAMIVRLEEKIISALAGFTRHEETLTSLTVGQANHSSRLDKAEARDQRIDRLETQLNEVNVKLGAQQSRADKLEGALTLMHWLAGAGATAGGGSLLFQILGH